MSRSTYIDPLDAKDIGRCWSCVKRNQPTCAIPGRAKKHPSEGCMQWQGSPLSTMKPKRLTQEVFAL